MVPIARRLRQLLALFAALAVATGVLTSVGGSAAAATTDRIAGADRYATAAAVSRSQFGAGVPVAFVVTGTSDADALAAGPVAAKRGGPVLLVRSDQIPAATAEELQRLAPGEIVVAGGDRSVSAGVAAELDRYTNGAVRRVAGPDRYGTAAALSAGEFPSSATAFVASGERFADALTAAPAAFRAGAPLLLVTPNAVPAATSDELRRLNASHVVLLGGPGAVDAEAESQLRSVVGDVSRLAGADRGATSAAVSASTFSPGVPVAYVATGVTAADALAAGPVAALAGGPVLLAGANCVSNAVNAELDRLAPGRIVLLGGASALGPGVEDRDPCPFAGAADHGVSVAPSAAPAYDDDGPDPDLVRFGSTWYAYTTGTTWGNRIGVLTSSSPDGGWHTASGRAFGSTALPSAPAWEVPDSQWAPGVFAYGGHYVLFYAALVRANGKRCLSVARGDSPTGPFVDRTTGPLICQTDIGGSIDPQPFIDADGKAWLYWKNNDGSSPAVSKVWAVPLGTDGMTPVAAAHEVLAKNRERYPWQTTVDNPQMVLANGVYYLFHTGGAFEGNGSYTTGYAVCAGALGPCTTAKDPILTSYGNVAGPGGGTVAGDGAGHWWISYHAWSSNCTSYDCGGKRRFYVAPLTFR